MSSLGLAGSSCAQLSRTGLQPIGPLRADQGCWGALNPADLEQQPQLCFNSSYAFFHRLENCGITCDSCQEISAVLGSSSSLIELSVGDNKIGDTGVAVLCQGLMHPNCKIQKLW